MTKYTISYILLSCIPMFVCAFWAIMFLVNYRHLPKSKKILCGFMLVATSLYFGHFIVFNHLYDWVPVTDTIYSLATLSVYPIFWIYIKSITERLQKRNLLILLPGVLLATVIGVCYALMPDEELYQFILECHYQEKAESPHLIAHVAMVAHRLMKPVIALQVILVLVSGFRKLWKFKRKVEQFYSNTEHRDLREIHGLLIFLFFTSCFSVIADLTGRAFFVDSLFMMTLVLTPFAVMLFAIGYVGYHQKFTIEDLIAETQDIISLEDETKELSEVQTPTEKRADIELRRKLLHDIDLLMERERLYLHENLKLTDLAEKLNTNRTYVYEALKLAEERDIHSFSEYVNRYRIEYSKELMKNHAEKCIKEIQEECGFASKAAFYANFKKMVGMTPKDYMKQQQQSPDEP